MKSLWDSVLWLRRKNKQDKEEILTAVNAVQNLFKTSGEATATASDIVAPKTAYNGTTLITGTIADKTGTSEYAATASIDNTNKKIKMQVPAAGKYGTKNYLYQSFSNIASLIGLTASKLVKNNTVLGITGNSSNMDTSGCDAAAAQILSGKKAGVKGNVVTGTMVNRAGTTVQAAAVTQDDDNTYFAVPEAAYYDKNSKIATANSNLGGAGCGIFYMTNGKTFTSNSATLTLQSDKYSYDKNYYTFSENTVIINKSGNYVVCGGTSTGYANIALSVNERIKIGKGAPGQTSDTFIRNFNTIVSLSKGDVCKVITTGTAWNGRATGFSSKSYFSIAYIPD